MSGALTFLIFLPVLAALPLLFEKNAKIVRWLAAFITLCELVVCLILYWLRWHGMMFYGPDFLYLDHLWIPRFGIHYALMMDGVSLLLATLTAFLFLLSVLASWNQVKERVALFHCMLLFLETGIMGVFLSADLFLFYLFWEVMLIPMFFLIGIWGHGRRVYSAVKFFVFTISGSLLMLLAIIGIYVLHGRQTGVYTFLLQDLIHTTVSPGISAALFLGFLLGFAVKVPLFPLHTWLPDAHTDAPTAGSVILAGLLLKTGAYGLLRVAFPLFPHAGRAFLPLIFTIAVIGMFYASWVALAQKDMKRLIAYSSVSHLAYVVLGIAVWNEVSLAGSVLQMVNHGITTGALFIMVGMMDERMHTHEMSAYGGLWSQAPGLSAFFLFFVLSSLGLPGLNNFAGEFLILTGLFRAHPYLCAAGFLGMVSTLIYLLSLAQKVLFGPRKDYSATGFSDLSGRELAVLIPLAILVVFIGVYPSILLRVLDMPVKDMVNAVSLSAYAGRGAP
ncbi:MAG: NADH-quinone oxidoreductase subunit M [Nitrospirota bacterium]